ncbi:hypothetical protein C6A87_004710 [Mycobacterium sp. ITM-2016-00317]|uniref:hypothetical protein n=1 Tax=Mycobacterium sp. ITM-2016-00317 TaxID=2099694 RepID=UPI000D4A517C|nr:hypothetical protein [Mycobacterium sp. ITM-2016-00317]WNG88546.1 hypothetical protein C6A87_004710 [Mycobacterium sp. ITM-2016-00317]
MDSSELGIAAWDLVDHCRPWLTPEERNTAFVRLGVGDYNDAMVIALKSAARAHAALPDELLSRLTALQQVYYFDRELAEVLAVVSRA